MRNLLLIAFLSLASQSYSTTITVFSEENGRCRYVIADNQDKPIAVWSGSCLENTRDTQKGNIKKGSSLWKALKKLDPSLDLQNITIVLTKDESVIAKLKALSIPEINPKRNAMAKSFRMNNDSKAGMEKRESQDYNSSRSNKANSISPAQDYNSSRSNKANSISPAQDYNSSRSNKANSISPAQDYNSSRSNKANSISPAQDYNSSRSNKANSISPAQDYNSSRSNKANSISSAQDYNSSRSNKANSISPAQDYNSSRSNKSGVILSVGMTLANKNSYMKSGFTIHAGYHIHVKNSIGFEVGIGLWLNSFSYSPHSAFPKEYKRAIEKSFSNNRWSNISISAGPSLTIGKGKCNATLYTKAAVLFTKIPEQSIGGDNPVAKFSGNQTSFALNPGLRLNYSMNSKISVFINPEFMTSLSKNIPFWEKDISKATNADGKFNPDTFQSLPLEKRHIGTHMFGVSAGLKINL